jgi:hypothetical protein
MVGEGFEEEVAPVVVARDGVGGRAQGREDTANHGIFLGGAVVGEIPADKDHIRPGIEAVDVRHGLLQLGMGGYPALAELVLSHDVQVGDLGDEQGVLS